MGDYCLRLPEEYVHQLEAIGEDVRTLHTTLQTAGRVDAFSTGDVRKSLQRLASLSRSPDSARGGYEMSDTLSALHSGLSSIWSDPTTKRLWASWQLEVLFATGMPKAWARAAVTDGSAALTLLVRGYYQGMYMILGEAMSTGTHVSSLVVTSSRFRDLAALDYKSLLTTVPDGTATLAGLAVQAAAMVGHTIPSIHEESAVSLLASLPLVAPASVAHLRQYLNHDDSGHSLPRVGHELGRGLLRE